MHEKSQRFGIYPFELKIPLGLPEYNRQEYSFV